jgi:hypothetical protein
MTIRNILRPFCILHGLLVWFVVILVYFLHFGMFGPRKIWQPCSLGESFLEENSNNEMVKCQLGFQNTIVTLSFFTKRDKRQLLVRKTVKFLATKIRSRG